MAKVVPNKDETLEIFFFSIENKKSLGVAFVTQGLKRITKRNMALK